MLLGVIRCRTTAHLSLTEHSRRFEVTGNGVVAESPRLSSEQSERESRVLRLEL